MKIFFACTDSPNTSGLPNSKIWYSNLYLPLVDLKHEVIRFDYDLISHFQNLNPGNPKQKKFIDKFRPKLERALIEQITAVHKKKKIDVFFSYFYSACCRKEAIEKIKKMGIITVNFYCNAVYQFDLIKDLAPVYDYCLDPEKPCLNDYKKIGANPVYFPYAANPNFYKKYDLPYKYDVTFVGQDYGNRFDNLTFLLKNKIDVHVWGPNWQRKKIKIKLHRNPKHYYRYLKEIYKYFQGVKYRKNFHGVLSDEDLVKLYSQSKINLGDSSCADTYKKRPSSHMKLRDFEVPMSGGFYLVEYIKELEEFFDIDKEIVCYYNKKDMLQKIKYYLANDDAREKIRETGYKRAQRDHTWDKRFKELFRKIDLTKKHA